MQAFRDSSYRGCFAAWFGSHRSEGCEIQESGFNLSSCDNSGKDQSGAVTGKSF